MSEPSPVLSKQLDRSLGLWSVFALSVGAMLGSGVFVLPGFAAAIAGPWVGLAFLLAGVIVLPAVLSESELATAMPVTGGTYTYIDRAMGPWMGTIAGLGAWLSMCTKIALTLVSLGAYVVVFWHVAEIPVAVGVLALLLVLNVVGVGKASGIQVAIVLVTLAALVVFVAIAAPAVRPELWVPAFPNGAAGMVGGVGFVIVAYAGVTKVTAVAEEVKNPERNLPLGMLLALLTVTTIYTVFGFVLTGLVPWGDLAHDERPMVTAADAVLGPVGTGVFAVVAILGLLSLCNAGVLASARYPFAMGRDQLLPRGLSAVGPRFGTPVRAIGLTGLVLAVLVTSLPIEELAHLASGMKILVFVLANLAVLVLRETGPAWYRPRFRSPLYPWTQLVGVAGCVIVLWQLGAVAVWGVALALIAGTAWYFTYAKARVDRRSALVHLWGATQAVRHTEQAEEEAAGRAPASRVIVPVFGGEAEPGRAMRLAAAFVNDGVLEVLRLEEVPPQLQLADVLSDDSGMSRLARQADVTAGILHVRTEFRDVVTHNAKAALLDHARATKAEWIVMEWASRRGLRWLVRHPMAWWLENPPCDLAIFKPGPSEPDADPGDPDDLPRSPTEEVRQGFTRVLALAEPGPYDSLVVYIADRLARQSDGEVTLFRPIPRAEYGARVESERTYHAQLQKACSAPSRSLVVPVDKSLDAIFDTTAKYDLLVMGAPAQGGWRTVFFDSPEHRITDGARCAVLRLTAPQALVHHRLAHSTLQDRRLGPFLEHAALRTRLRVARKTELFSVIARELAAACGHPVPEDIESALWDRERRQNTALQQGVSLTAPSAAGIGRTTLGVFTIQRPIDFMGTTSPLVDVCVVSLAPPGDRHTQLWLLDRIAGLVLNTDLLHRLRDARDDADVRGALEAAERAVTP